jgi:hypothetical protein
MKLDNNDNKMNRRQFLKCLAGGAVAATALLKFVNLATAKTLTTTSAPSANLAAFMGKSLVVKVGSPRVVSFEGFNRRILQEMIMSGISEMVGVTSFSKALNELFSKKDIIGFKFNEFNADLLRTNVPLAEELLRLMVRNGFKADQIFFMGAQPNDPDLPPCRKIQFGWGKTVDFGSGSDQFIGALDQATAIVSVATLKASSIVGIDGCLKNITLDVLKHPVRYYGNNGIPHIPDIYALPMIRDRLRFNLLSALKVLIRSEQITEYNAVEKPQVLLFSKDPLAVDSVGFELLDNLRKSKSLGPLVEGSDFPHHLVVAGQRNLGVYHPDQIYIREIKTF